MRILASTALVAASLVAMSANAAVKTYQVTGPVLAVDDSAITVQKGSEKWEIARDASTKVTGDPKVGSKVTIEYRMTATTVDAKGGEKASDKSASAAAKKK
jgi:hypothetical protein